MSWVHIKSKDELEAFYKSVLPKIREVARSCGYAIGLHGSMRRDLDLIAVPWGQEFTGKNVLAAEIHKAACGLESAKYEWEQKSGQRQATCFPICWIELSKAFPMEASLGHIDLSVMEWVELSDERG